MKSHLSVIVKHHKEKGYKGSKNTKDNIRSKNESVLAENCPENAMHSYIKKADGNSNAYTQKKNPDLIYKRLTVAYRKTLPKKDVGLGASSL